MHHRTKTPIRYCLPILVSLFVLTTSSAWSHDLSGYKQFKELPPDLHTALGTAESFAEKALFAQAKETLAAYAAAHPAESHPLLFYELGYFCYRSGEYTQAVTYLQKTSEIAPGFKDCWQVLALSWQERGNLLPEKDKKSKQEKVKSMQNGAQAMEKAAHLADDDNLHYQSALLWLNGEKPQNALVILEKLCQLPSVKQEWLVALSDTLKALKRHEETAEAMEKAARTHNNPELLFHTAWLWTDLEKPERALPLLTILTEKKKVDKNWLLLLASVYNTLQLPGKAAGTLERVIEIDPTPDYLYNCGVLWLQDEKPDNALRSLSQLADITPPKADWFVATAQAWLVKENLSNAADAMERAAKLSKNPEHIYKAGALRLQLKQADRAITLLTPLSDHPKPKAEWMVALANSWLLKESYLNAARFMERAAVISGKGNLYHQAAMLWRVENRLDKTIELLQKSVATKKVEQLWLVDLASVLIDADRDKAALPIMKRTNLEDKTVSKQLRYRGAVLWLNLQEPSRAYPLLTQLCNTISPRYSWMSSLVKTCVELDRSKEAEAALKKVLNLFPGQVKSWKLAVWHSLQQADYIGAAAAKEIVLSFEPNENKHIEDLSRLYLLAGVPLESARAFERTLGPEPTAEQRDHLVDIYVSGRMYRKALIPAQQRARSTNSAENWESLGDIYYALHRFEESLHAYEEATKRGDKPNTFMKAAYAAMKADRFDRAANDFQRAIEESNGEKSIVDSALQNLAYIQKKQEQISVLN